LAKHPHFDGSQRENRLRTEHTFEAAIESVLMARLEQNSQDSVMVIYDGCCERSPAITRRGIRVGAVLQQQHGAFDIEGAVQGSQPFRIASVWVRFKFEKKFDHFWQRTVTGSCQGAATK
jgi:hypothetical protein